MTHKRARWLHDAYRLGVKPVGCPRLSSEQTWSWSAPCPRWARFGLWLGFGSRLGPRCGDGLGWSLGGGLGFSAGLRALALLGCVATPTGQ